MTPASNRRRPLDVLRNVLAEHGPVWGWFYLLHTLLVRATRGSVRLVPYTIVAQPLAPGRVAGLRPDPQTVVRRAGATDPLQADFPRPPEINRARYHAGAECFVAQVKGAFAGHIWFSRGRHVEDEVRCEYRLEPPAALVWDFDVYVAPRFRLGRTLGRLWQDAGQALAAEGVTWTLSRISLFNAASLQAHQRLGAVRLATAFFLVAGPLQVAVFTCAPILHVGLARRHSPVLRLRAPSAG